MAESRGITAVRLEEVMTEKGVDQIQLAKLAGCTQGAVSQILLGKTQRSKFLPDIAIALGVSLYWLKGASDDRYAEQPSAPTTTFITMPVALPNAVSLTDMFVAMLEQIEIDPHEDGRADTLARIFPASLQAALRRQAGLAGEKSNTLAKPPRADDEDRSLP